MATKSEKLLAAAKLLHPRQIRANGQRHAVATETAAKLEFESGSARLQPRRNETAQSEVGRAHPSATWHRPCIGTLITAAVLAVAQSECMSAQANDDFIEIRGKIEPATLERFLAHPRIRAGRDVWVVLDSPGGDVDTALAIGRILRKTRSTAAVRVGGRCLSSCVFLLAGAVRRFDNEPVIGIHRPFPVSTAATDYAAAQGRYRGLAARVQAFLDEMNMPPSLFEAIMVVPSDEVRILTRDELTRFGLLDLDPVEADIRDANEAREHGLTRSEYYARRALVSQRCVREGQSILTLSDEQIGERVRSYSECAQRILRDGR